MPSIIPTWPAATDVTPGLLDGSTPISAQWMNFVAQLLEILESEVGPGSWPISLATVLDFLTYNVDYGGGTQGKLIGYKFMRVTATAANWSAGFGGNMFNATPFHNPALRPVSFAIAIGTAAGGAGNGLMKVNAYSTTAPEYREVYLQANHLDNATGLAGNQTADIFQAYPRLP